jgi:hypothetical protein
VTDATEAAGDALTGAIIAHAVEPQAGAATPAVGSPAHSAVCLNCGATLTGAFCAACGQPAHLHRSFVSLGHDILHSVFHFDTKLFRTLPELVFHPGRLTRRYIDGERAKFISPMAVYLLSVFLMYAVFSFTGGAAPTVNPSDIPGVRPFQLDNRAEIETIRRDIQELQTQLDAPELSADRRVELESRIAGLEISAQVMEAIGQGDWASLERIQEQAEETLERQPQAQEAGAESDSTDSTSGTRFGRSLAQFNDNPRLMAYKLKTNGYKFSWMLVPLSIPFMWPLFFWRRNVKAYDHAVFVSYSISFMMLLLIFVSLLGLAGVGTGWLALLVMVVPPLHMYKQLRGTYQLSRLGAFSRLWLLVLAASIVLVIFAVLLIYIGALD